MFLIVLENHAYSQIVGNPDAPYLNALTRTAWVAANFRAITHPSEPNYIALVSGSTHGVTSDDVTRVQGRSLANQLSVRSYMQGLNGPLYALKHDPFAVLGRHSEDWARFPHDPLAKVTLIVPDLCHDMHGAGSCSDDAVLVRAGDSFVKSAITAIRKRDRHALVVVTFDEGSDSDNRVLTLVAGAEHAVSHRAYTHYSLVRTIERHFDVPCLAAACTAPLMTW